MPVVYNTNVKNDRLQVVVDALGASSRLEIGTLNMGLVLATIELGNPVGTIAGGTLTFSGFPRIDVSADASGRAASARIVDGSNVTVISDLTVGVASFIPGDTQPDIVLDIVDILAGQLVQINSAMIIGA